MGVGFQIYDQLPPIKGTSFYKENNLYISQQFYSEKQVDWATYRSTSLTGICICFHLASNNLRQDKCNIIDYPLKIEIQSGARNLKAIFCLAGHFNTNLKKQVNWECMQQVIGAVNRHEKSHCELYELSMFLLWLFLYVICKRLLIYVGVFCLFFLPIQPNLKH